MGKSYKDGFTMRPSHLKIYILKRNGLMVRPSLLG